jgi:ABC-2 type transport system permease protein
MFSHIYVYRLKCLIRDRQLVFWTLLFPILLAILFEMALSNITKGEVFKEIKIAVADSEEFQKNTDFKQVLESVSTENDGSRLFDITYTSKEECVNLLKDGKIEGYIYCDNGIRLEVKNNGLNETVIKSFLDDYKQTVATAQTIITKNPQALQQGFISELSERKDYLKDVAASDAEPDTAVHYFYTLIAMACLYGSFWGFKEVNAIQANQSAQGARVSVAPTHKVKVFTVCMLAAVTAQIAIILMLLLFLVFVLGVDFGNKIGYIVLTCIVGAFTGVTFGTFSTILVKKSEGIKVGILIGSSMLMSFLAGMMFDGIKLIIRNNVPVLSYLNPANLIADSFYALYFYSGTTHYFINLLILCAMTVVFGFITYIVLRRQKYASL